MQYVGKVGGYVYNQWNSLNPATLSGAIDIIVIEQPDGLLHCSPWHVRFGKFQIIKPLQKKIDLYVNGIKTDLPMKLGEGGEAFFVFEIDKESGADLLSKSVMTSPVVSAASSPPGSLPASPQLTPAPTGTATALSPANSMGESTLNLNVDNLGDPLSLDYSQASPASIRRDIEEKVKLSASPASPHTPKLPRAVALKIAFAKAMKITQKLNIPSKIDINGDMVLDMDGYKPNSQRNIDNSDELFNKIFMEEMKKLQQGDVGSTSGHDESQWEKLISKDEDGNIRIIANSDDELDADLEEDDDHPSDLKDDEGAEFSDEGEEIDEGSGGESEVNLADSDKTYFKTLRLTSDQLKQMKLHYGENQLVFKLHEGTSQTTSNLFLWKSTTPIVISDIDGTITKSDALGHVLNLIGRDWTHPGVATMFLDIKANGYNIMYLTARSVGQADTTRQYLKNVIQEGNKLPAGPVILSPDRTMAALRREVILKKPEVFKMSCLSDIKNLYFNLFELSLDQGTNGIDVGISGAVDDDRTPFYAGFGNKITDAISYRSVGIPSHRIFTINPDGEVHMELLELAGYRSSYLHIGELVDHFFPPIKAVPDSFWNDNQFHQYMHNKVEPATPTSPGSPDYDGARSIASGASADDYYQYPNPQANNTKAYNKIMGMKTDERFNDVNYWRDPLPNLSDLSDEDEDTVKDAASAPEPKSPSTFSIRSFKTAPAEDRKKTNATGANRDSYASLSPKSAKKERPTSMSSITSPLKSFMMGPSATVTPAQPVTTNEPEDEATSTGKEQSDPHGEFYTPDVTAVAQEGHDPDANNDDEDDYTTEEDYDDDYDDDYEDDGEIEDEDDDEYEDEIDEDADDDDDNDEEEDEDLDHDGDVDMDDGMPRESTPLPPNAHGGSPIDLLHQQDSHMRSKKSQVSLGAVLGHDPKFVNASELLGKLDLRKED